MTESIVETVLHGEEVRTGVERVAVRRAILRRIVVRELRTVEIEVAHEEYRVEYVDVEPGTAAPERLEERSVSVELREERVELVCRVVPVERITLSARPTASAQQVDLALAREIVEVEEERSDSVRRTVVSSSRS